MVKIVLIAGGALTFALFMVTVLSGIDSADRDGRIPMPGEKSLELDEGKYGIYYEEAVETSENETFEPPEGIRIRVRGLGGAPEPELDLGGLGNQIGTDNRTAESIGKLEVSEKGRYGMVVGPPPRPAPEPTITVGETGSGSLLRGLKVGGIVAGATALLAGLLMLGRRVRGEDAPPPRPTAFPSAPPPRPPAPTPMIPLPPQPKPDPLVELEKLAAQKRSGQITPAEFERRKAQLLADM